MSNTQTTTEPTQGVESVFHKVRLEVIESYPSIYTKDDVIQLIDRIQTDLRENGKDGNVIGSNLLEKVKQRVKSVVLKHDFDDDVNIEIGYDRSVEVEVNGDSLLDELHENIEEVFETEGVNTEE